MFNTELSRTLHGQDKMERTNIFQDYQLLKERQPVNNISYCGISRAGACFYARGIHKGTFHSGYEGLDSELWRLMLIQTARYGITYARDNSAHILFHNSWSSGYYHWVVEALPRLIHLRKEWRKKSIIIPPKVPNAWFAEWLEKISGGNNFKLRHGLSLVRAVAFQKNPERMNLMAEQDIMLVSDFFKSFITREGLPAGPEKVYITRAAASHRRIANESEVINYMESEGFAICDPAQLSFPEQLSLFSTARVVVSIHGAGLSNILFMPTNGAVIEFFQRPDPVLTFGKRRNTHLLNPCFKMISGIMGHNHITILGDFDTSSTPREVIRQYGTLHGNLKIDLDKLKQVSSTWK